MTKEQLRKKRLKKTMKRRVKTKKTRYKEQMAKDDRHRKIRRLKEKYSRMKLYGIKGAKNISKVSSDKAGTGNQVRKPGLITRISRAISR